MVALLRPVGFAQGFLPRLFPLTVFVRVTFELSLGFSQSILSISRRDEAIPPTPGTADSLVEV